MITKIEIRNFRSIERMNLDCKDITTFIGENDAGKSNVLRALNLFFNNETDYGQSFNFDRDFYRHAKEIRGKAKEIQIILTLNLPQNYIKKNLPQTVTWRKIWRKDGIKNEKERLAYTNGRHFEGRSRIPTLLSRIQFRYVPAVKDRNFFAKLQGDLYEVLAKVADEELRNSAKSFEASIKSELEKLHVAGDGIIRSARSLELPKDLRSIFEILQFVGEDGIPLQHRGDGIQMRHIPEILKFMGEKHNSPAQKTPNFTYIWGFEEPENSIEMSACFDMREALENAIRTSKSTTQIFLTTHSPIFYRIGTEKNSRVDTQSYVVQKSEDDKSNSKAIRVTDLQTLDKDMGLMPLIVPHIEEERNGRLEAEEALRKAGHNPSLLVEGKWDKKVIEKALSLFFPKVAKQIRIIDCGNNNKVRHYANAWPTIMPNLLAATLTDRDKKKTDSSNKKGFSNEKIIHLEWELDNLSDNLKQEADFFPADLESCYSDKIWKHANSQQGWLQPSSRPIEGQFFIKELNLSLEERIRIGKQFTESGKKKAAEYITNQNDDEAKEALVGMKLTLEKVVQHLTSKKKPEGA